MINAFLEWEKQKVRKKNVCMIIQKKSWKKWEKSRLIEYKKEEKDEYEWINRFLLSDIRLFKRKNGVMRKQNRNIDIFCKKFSLVQLNEI